MPDSSSWPSTSAESSFIASYPRLARVGRTSGVLLYPGTGAEVIDRLRSELPPTHAAYLGDAFGIDDRVLVRMRLPAAEGSEYFVVHTDGPSGDPGFYLVDASTGRESPVIWGEVLALPESGEFAMYQRTNTFFPKRKRVRVDGGELVEVAEPRYTVGLRTIALDSLFVVRSEQDSTIVARLGRGDSVEVLEASDESTTGRYPLWLRTASGVRGLVMLDMPQCPAALLRGLCFFGD